MRIRSLKTMSSQLAVLASVRILPTGRISVPTPFVSGRTTCGFIFRIPATRAASLPTTGASSSTTPPTAVPIILPYRMQKRRADFHHRSRRAHQFPLCRRLWPCRPRNGDTCGGTSYQGFGHPHRAPRTGRLRRMGTPDLGDGRQRGHFFFIRDITNGSKIPFLIEPKTPESTLCLKSSGKIGIGTWYPTANLEVENQERRCDALDGPDRRCQSADRGHVVVGPYGKHLRSCGATGGQTIPPP